MAGASIEATLELWASSLREVKSLMRPLFAQERAAVNAGLFLDGLLGDERRKTGWMRAEAAGDPGPWRQQALLGRDRWDADALRDMVRDYVMEHLADDDAVLVVDETGLSQAGQGIVRRGAAVYGFRRQDHELPDRRVCHLCIAPRPWLYRPGALFAKGWTDDPARLKAHIRAKRRGLCDQASAGSQDDRARHCGTAVPFRWVAGDSVYGVGDIERDATPGRQGLCAWRPCHPCLSVLGQAACDCRHRCKDRQSAGSI